MSSIEALINRQLQRWEMERRLKQEAKKEGKKPEFKPIVTVSRQRGSQGSYLAEQLAGRLDYQLLHREIIDEISNSSGYRRQIIESLDDRVRSKIELWFEGMFKGLYIDASDYIRHLYKVIMSISELGGVVVVGRGASFMLAHDQSFHLRIIAAVPKRIENLVKYQGLTREQAEREVKELDRARSEFVRNNFRRDIDDPSTYDMIINTTYIGINDALELAEAGIKSKWKVLGSGALDW
jgi:cytidylate kinase